MSLIIIGYLPHPQGNCFSILKSPQHSAGMWFIKAIVEQLGKHHPSYLNDTRYMTACSFFLEIPRLLIQACPRMTLWSLVLNYIIWKSIFIAHCVSAPCRFPNNAFVLRAISVHAFWRSKAAFLNLGHFKMCGPCWLGNSGNWSPDILEWPRLRNAGLKCMKPPRVACRDGWWRNVIN